jgi:hypothetical protein
MGSPRRRCLRGLRGALRGILLRLAVAFLGQVGMPPTRVVAPVPLLAGAFHLTHPEQSA